MRTEMLTIAAQVYYFYSYGTAAWLGTFSVFYSASLYN
jgi:hypothetical protein